MTRSTTGYHPAVPAGEQVRLRDARVLIRPVRSSDRSALLDLHTPQSPVSLYLRFFGGGRAVESANVDRLLRRTAGPDHQVLTAWSAETLVAMAAFERIDADTADLAVLVDDNWHHRGVGTALTLRLAAIALQYGITRFVADILTDNVDAIRMVRDLGLPTVVTFTGGVGQWVIVLDRPAPDVPAVAG